MSDDLPPEGAGAGKEGLWSRLTAGFRSQPQSRRDIERVLAAARAGRLLDADEQAMLEGVMAVSDTQVRDIMIPRAQMVVIERDADPREMLEIIVESGHSRFPVIGDGRDEVVGILLAKDLLRYFVEGGDDRFHLREYLRSAVFIPESKRLNVLLKEFRLSHNHMAIVVDEYGGVSGLLTIEDVLEEIVGEIDDEHDFEEDSMISPEGEGVYTVAGLTRIEDLNDQLGTRFRDEDYDTVGGLIMHELGRMPRRGESLTVDGARLTVVKSDRRRIHSVRLQPAGDR
jgi:magnesium and cobalt transporter